MDRAQAALAGEVAHYERMAEQIRRVRRALVGITGTAESEDGLITATVDVRGELTELWIDPRIYRFSDSVTLAEQIVGACRAASKSAQRQAFDASAAMLPPDASPDGTDLAFDPVLHGLDRQARAAAR